MKTITKILLAAASVAGLTATAANAQDWGSLSATFAVESDYRFRGISQNSREATPEVGLNWTLPQGFYASLWSAKTNWGGNNPSFELDIYGGKHFDLGGTDLNIEAYYYSYPDAKVWFPGAHTSSYYETIVQLSHTFGPLSVTVTGTNSPQWSIVGGTGWYTSGMASYALTDWLSVSGTVGHQWVDTTLLKPNNYTHWDLGATATWKSLAVDARYVATDIGKANCSTYWMGTKNACQAGFKAMLTYTVASFP